jgi:hypothetical protein
MRVTNGIPLGSSLLLPVDTVNCVATLKAGAKCTGGFNYSTATTPEVMQGFVNASNDGIAMTM